MGLSLRDDPLLPMMQDQVTLRRTRQYYPNGKTVGTRKTEEFEGFTWGKGNGKKFSPPNHRQSITSQSSPWFLWS